MDALPQGLNLQRRAGFARRARHWHAGAPYVGTKFVNVEVLLKVFWQQLDDYLEPVLRKLTQFVPVELVEKIFQLFTVCFSELHKNGHAFPGLLNFLDRPRPIFGSNFFCHWSTNSHFFWPVVVQIFFSALLTQPNNVFSGSRWPLWGPIGYQALFLQKDLWSKTYFYIFLPILV